MSTEPTPAARDLVATAMGRAMEDAARGAGPVVPISMHRRAAADALRRYRSTKHASALEQAREALTVANDDAMWVLVWDGYITIDEWRTDAIYAHLESGEQDVAHLFAWRYGLHEDGHVGPVGAVMYLGLDGRYATPERSHPLPAGEAPVAPHGQGVPGRRLFRRRGAG